MGDNRMAIEDKYKCIKRLGKGTYGTAYLAVERGVDPPEPVVVKKVSIRGMKVQDISEALKEAHVLKALNHPNIIRHVDHFITENRRELWILAEYANKGDLSAKVKARQSGGHFFTEKRIWQWFIQITLALKHLHDRKILHRDLKTANVFLSQYQEEEIIKLGDFGIAKVLDETKQNAKTAIGTPYYMSPELCEHKPYNAKSDVWALGCILYELCTLRQPFDAQDFNALVVKIVAGRYPPIHSSYRSELQQTVDKLLNRDSSQRPDTNQILRLEYILPKVPEYSKIESNILEDEMSHTHLHGINVLVKNRRNELRQGTEVVSAPQAPAVAVPPTIQADGVPARRPSSRTGPRQAWPDNIDWNAEEISTNSDEESEEAAPWKKGKFYFNGETIKLGTQDCPAEDDSVHQKAEQLKIFLEDGLGPDLFMRVYRIMCAVSADDDDRQLESQLLSMVGRERAEYLNVICQLIFCEDSLAIRQRNNSNS